MRLLYLCDADGGGIAEYAIRQFHALCDAGLEASFLCRPTFEIHRLQRPGVMANLPAPPTRHRSKAGRVLQKIREARAVAQMAANSALEGGYDALLIACYGEYFSPFWADVFRKAADKGLAIGTIAHDPVRDFVLGPRWWHQWSVRRAYSFVRHVFVHDDTPVDFGGKPPEGVRIHIIPHGPFEVAPATREREEVRAGYGFSEQDQVFLAFGQIRDGKNLDRFLRVMSDLPENVKLLVAGSGGGGSQRQPREYPRMAEELGVAERCVWDFRYIPDEETGDLFAAADVVLMSYSAKFRSASGVMNAAVAARKPILGSSGEGPFRSAMRGYGLGVFIEPDDDAAILDGARRILGDPGIREWERYERENSWAENARRVIAAYR